VRLAFDDPDLKRLYTDGGFPLPRLSPELITAFRKKVGFLAQATTQQDIRAMRSFNLEKLKGDREGQYSIRLNIRWRLILRFETDEEGPFIAVVEIVDYH